MGNKTGHFKTFFNCHVCLLNCVLLAFLFNAVSSQKNTSIVPGCCPRSGPFSCYGVGSCDFFCCNCIDGCQPGAVDYGKKPLFDQLDKDQNGALTLSEINEYFKEVLYINDYDINKCSIFEGFDFVSLFYAADENNNNQVEREEFQKLKEKVPILSAIIDGSSKTSTSTSTSTNDTYSSTPSSTTFFELVSGKLTVSDSDFSSALAQVNVNTTVSSSNDRNSLNPRQPKMTVRIAKSVLGIKTKVNNVNDDDELVNIVLNEFDTDFLTVYSSVNTTLGISNSNYPSNSTPENENLTISSGTGNTTTFEFSTAKNQMYHVGVACAADYQLKWTSNIPSKSQWSKKTFFSFENYDEHFLNPENDTNTIPFELWISSGLSGVLSCEDVTDPTLSTRIYIFGQGTTHFVSCPSKTNKNQVERLLQSARKWFLTEDQLNLYDFFPFGLFYLSIKTIILDNHQNSDESNRGHFFVPCQSNFPNLTAKNVGKELRLIEHRDFQRKQVVKQIFRILGNQTREKCDDISGSVLQYDPTKGFLVPNHAEHPAWYTCEYFNSDSNSTESQNIISYLKDDSDTGRKLITGNYKFNSDNTFDANTLVPTGISCIDHNGSIVVIVMKPCTSPFACDLQDFCTGDDDDMFESSPQVSYRSIEYPYNQGVVLCINVPNLREIPIKDYTFIGLDKIRYWVSGYIPDRALINIQETEPVLHTNKQVDFSCEVSTFLLRSSNITFMVTMNISETGNSTQKIRADPKLLNVTLEASNLNVTLHKYQEFTDLGFGVMQISVHLRKDIVAIICSAEWYNQTTVLSTSRKFEARDVAKPNIQRDSDTATYPAVSSNNVVKKVILFKNKEDQSIPCSASGEPSPTVWWDRKKTDKKSVIYLGNTTGVSLLTFQSIDDSVEGRYTCHAQNEYGDDLYYFDVSVQDPGVISGWGITGIAVGSLALLIISICLIGLIRKYRQVKSALRDLTDEEVKEFTEGKPGSSATSKGETDIGMLPFNPDFILPPSHLMIEKSAILGEGQFGIVYRGLLEGNAVAVKTTKPDADILYVKSFLAELKIMGHIGKHANVVEFLGAVTDQIRERKIQAVVELSPIGSLESYLAKIRTGRDSLAFVNLLSSDGSEIVYSVEKQGSLLSPYTAFFGETNKEVQITTLHLIDWCKQIAAGMEFLASKNVVHADLATRNVLVFHDNVVKVSDFGLSKQLYSCATYVKKQKTMLPWRWMALETLLHMEFSIKSDVWSYGVTVWEILSMGQVPYPGLINWSNEFVNILSGGMRMAKPAFSTKTIYDQMVQCWDVQPEKRPSFTELLDFFEMLLQPFSSNQTHLQCDDSNDAAESVNEALQHATKL